MARRIHAPKRDERPNAQPDSEDNEHGAEFGGGQAAAYYGCNNVTKRCECRYERAGPMDRRKKCGVIIVRIIHGLSVECSAEEA